MERNIQVWSKIFFYIFVNISYLLLLNTQQRPPCLTPIDSYLLYAFEFPPKQDTSKVSTFVHKEKQLH